ncbi:hypothetical protein EV126DRAFT_12790 [Verticillium dahliae]|nr:hypothetical protein EV126DRAFT_12790 [Verticillium dahliae]
MWLTLSSVLGALRGKPTIVSRHPSTTDRCLPSKTVVSSPFLPWSCHPSRSLPCVCTWAEGSLLRTAFVRVSDTDEYVSVSQAPPRLTSTDEHRTRVSPVCNAVRNPRSLGIN